MTGKMWKIIYMCGKVQKCVHNDLLQHLVVPIYYKEICIEDVQCYNILL